MKYRPEIDGLRAIAVIPVIFFHAGFNVLSGGFLGVDVFFVISGFLITSIISSEINNKSFSIINFYERRVRRIAPALFIVIIASIPFALFLMTPFELENFGKSVIATIFFLSNIFFCREISYFAPTSDLSPLLHTWSLGIEEQFYIFYPIIFLLLIKFCKRLLFPALVFSLILSLLLAEWASIHYTQASFFLLPTRAWELLSGAIAFMISQKYILRKRGFSEILSFIGVSLIIGSYFLLDDTMRLPGFLSVFCVLGTCLILCFTTKKTIIGRLLSLRIFIIIGAMSYSLYLWHQPVFAFAKLYFWDVMNINIYLALIALTFLLSIISWHFVEKPFRKKDLFSVKRIFSLFGIITFLLAIIAALIFTTHGLPNRSEKTKGLDEVEDRFAINYGISPTCDEDIGVNTTCISEENNFDTILWGNSYAMHLAEALKNSSPKIDFMQLTKSVCTPVLGISPLQYPKYNESWAKECLEFNIETLKFIKRSKKIKYVVMSAPYTSLLNKEKKAFLPDGQIIDGSKTNLVQKISELLSEIKSSGKTPVIISPPPRDGRNIAICHIRSRMSGQNPSKCNIKKSDYEKFSANVISFLKEIEKDYPVIWLSDYLCDDQTCYTYINETFIYRDSGHLSKEGSAYLGKKINLHSLLRDQ